jgi:hypothetical protein
MSLQLAIASRSGPPRVIVDAAAKFDVLTARAPGTGDPEVEFVFAFLLARDVHASWHPKAILCTTKIKLNGSADVHAC